jgi:hypothetical protein
MYMQTQRGYDYQRGGGQGSRYQQQPQRYGYPPYQPPFAHNITVVPTTQLLGAMMICMRTLTPVTIRITIQVQ